MARPEDRLVYSTDQPYAISTPKKKNPERPVDASLPNDGVIRIAREKRRGGVVTIIHGLAEPELKTTGGVITLQGDHRETVHDYLTGLGRRCKMAGG